MPELSAPVAGVPMGCIVMWSGLLLDIPDGWSLCDGTLGTPDLQDRFICGASALAEPGAVGGGNSHSHTGSAASGGAHVHAASSAAAGGHTPAGSAASAGAHTHTTVSHNHAMGNAEVRFGPLLGSSLQANRVSSSVGGGFLNIGLGTTREIFSMTSEVASNQTIEFLQLQNQSTAAASPGVNSGGAHTHALSMTAVPHHAHGVTVNSGGAHTHALSMTAVPHHAHGVTVNSGGAHTHTLSMTAVPHHAHGVTVNSGGAHTHTTSTDTVDHRPRFFALAFIMKL